LGCTGEVTTREEHTPQPTSATSTPTEMAPSPTAVPTFASPTPSASPSLTILWEHPIAARGFFYELRSDIPPIMEDVVYLSTERAIYALNLLTGGEWWRFEYQDDVPDSNRRVLGMPGVSQDRVYFLVGERYGEQGDLIYALDRVTGDFQWKVELDGVAQEGALATDGERLFFYEMQFEETYSRERVVALDARVGEVEWQFEDLTERTNLHCYPLLSPLVAARGIVYVPCIGRLYALDGLTGERLWRFTPPSPLLTPLAVSDGILYLSWFESEYKREGQFLALDAARGDVLWDYLQAATARGPAVVQEGVVYWVGSDDRIYALRAKTGELVWASDEDEALTGPLLVTEEAIYVGSDLGLLTALSPIDGERLWQEDIRGNLRTSREIAPVAVTPEALYLASQGMFLALGPGGGAASAELEGPSLPLESARVAPGIHVLAVLATDEIYRGWEHLYPFSWSPQGGIAFVWDEGIWVATAPDFTPQKLVEGIPYLSQPVWSPDGRRLAFIGSREWEGFPYGSLWVIDADGSHLREVTATEPPVVGWKVVWIIDWLDEHMVALDDHRGTSAEALVTVDVERGEIIDWSEEFEIWGGSFHWSPTREYLVASSFYGTRLVKAADKTETTLSQDQSLVQEFPVWAPDGQRFLYIQYDIQQETTRDLWVWDVAQGKGRPLLPNIYRAVWSPAGSRIAFLLLGNPSYDQAGRLASTDFEPGQPFDLYFGLLSWPDEEIITLIPIQRRLEFEGTTAAWYWFDRRVPIWSPEGRQVIYWGSDDEVWIMNAQGTGQKRLTQGTSGAENEDSEWDLPLVTAVYWSPDSKMVAIATSDQIWIIERPEED